MCGFSSSTLIENSGPWGANNVHKQMTQFCPADAKYRPSLLNLSAHIAPYGWFGLGSVDESDDMR